MENQDKIQDVLGNFQKSPSKEIPPVLEDYLRTVAKTGITVFPWQQLKILFVQKLEQVMEQFHKDDPCDHHTPFPNVENTKFIEMRQRIIDAFQRFNGAPFTVQRICELVTQPKKHYTQCDKFLRGIEKNVMVVSTVDPCGRKIVSESRALVNGLDMNGLNNQQRGNLNDITDGQPFGPMPLADWPGNNVATVWPQPAATDNKNNSSSMKEEQSKLEKVNELKSDENIQEDTDSGLLKAVPEPEASENQLVVKDSVVKDSAHLDNSSTSVSCEPQDKTEKSENSKTECVTNQEVSDKSSEAVKQSSEVSLEEDTLGHSDNQSEGSTDEKNADKSASCEKHAMEVSDSAENEPPEKRLKVDHSEDSMVSDKVEREPVSQEPAEDKCQGPDSTKESSQVEECSTSSEPTEPSENATDTQCKILSQDSEKSDDSREPDSGDSETTQQLEVNNVVQGDSQSEATTQNAIEKDKSENSLGNTANSESIEEPASEPNISTETVSNNAENITTAEDIKLDEKQQTQEVDGAEEQTVDGSTAVEKMDTETVPESKNTAVDKTETVDESEPMDQE